MAGDALDWVSKISSILGLWTFIGIITFLILCWRRISYVYRLRDARKKARGQIQSIQYEIQSLIDAHPNVDGVICQVLHNSIQDREQRLNILSRVEDSPWFSFSALFRADPCLRLLEGLEQDLKQKVQRMTEARETRLLIQEAYTLLDARQNAASPNDDTSNPRDVGSIIRTNEVDAIGQPGDIAYHDLSGGHSTGIETMSTGTGASTGNLRQRVPYLDNVAVALLKPRPTQGRVVILPRIETHVYLNIDLLSGSWNAIQLPLTKSVKQDDSSRIWEGIEPLLLVINARGSTTRQEYNRVCEQCVKRMGNSIGPQSLIDFHSPSNILTPRSGIVQVHFTFSCYSRHHQKEDDQYVLELILKDASNPSEPIVVAKTELPYSFDVRTSRPRIEEPTSGQLRQANITPSSIFRRGAKHAGPATTPLPFSLSN